MKNEEGRGEERWKRGGREVEERWKTRGGPKVLVKFVEMKMS
jgi:hypothetical protein